MAAYDNNFMVKRNRILWAYQWTYVKCKCYNMLPSSSTIIDEEICVRFWNPNSTARTCFCSYALEKCSCILWRWIFEERTTTSSSWLLGLTMDTSIYDLMIWWSEIKCCWYNKEFRVGFEKRRTVYILKIFDTILANLSCIYVEYLSWFKDIRCFKSKTSSISYDSTTDCSRKSNPWHQGWKTVPSHLNTPRWNHFTRNERKTIITKWLLSFWMIENN